MVKAIIYNSNSGFTKQYAYHFALKCNLPIYTIKEAKKNLTKGDEIIYFSWIFANKIVKLKKVLKYKISYVACVGMSFYSEELINTLKEYNNINNLYYLQGGIRMRELKPSQRILISMVKSSLKKKCKKKIATKEEEILLDRINNGYERIDLNALDHLIDYYNDNNNLVS